MAALTEQVAVRLDAEALAALERLAEKEDRKPAAVARRFIRDGLIAAGELAAAVTRG